MAMDFTEQDFDTPEGRQKIAQFLSRISRWQEGVHEQFHDLILANQEKLIAMGKVYAKPENINFQ